MGPARGQNLGQYLMEYVGVRNDVLVGFLIINIIFTNVVIVLLLIIRWHTSAPNITIFLSFFFSFYLFKIVLVVLPLLCDTLKRHWSDLNKNEICGAHTIRQRVENNASGN